MKYSGIGGQAVIEGVMMKNKDRYAVAVRKPDHEIEIRKGKTDSIRDKYKFMNAPIIRGVVSFVESLVMGTRTLNYSASFYEEEENPKDEKKESLLMGLVMVIAIVAAIGIFVVVPFLISEALSNVIKPLPLRGLLEGIIRVTLFVIYVKLVSLMEDIKRVFMYHGAEHKCINCVENGLELTVENVKKQTTVHKRCGTSFMLIVMFVSILFFMFIALDNIWLRMVLRILLVPVIAGVAYEFIHFAGNHDNKVIDILSKPGLWLQGLTTKEPDEEMIEVAIASVDAVFDWKDFIVHVDEEDVKEESVEQVEEKNVEKQNKKSKKKTKKQETTIVEKEVTATKDTTSLEADGDIEIVGLDAEDEEEDEILNALDRFFEAPKPTEYDEKTEDSDK